MARGVHNIFIEWRKITDPHSSCHVISQWGLVRCFTVDRRNVHLSPKHQHDQPTLRFPFRADYSNFRAEIFKILKQLVEARVQTFKSAD